jgi:hypothetical protein
MKAHLFQMISALSAMAIAAPAYTQENIMKDRTASFIEMPAAHGQHQAFSKFLTDAASLVEETEPGTELWVALQSKDTLAIFDIFSDADARDTHFSGVVAGALATNADRLVLGGWDDGVVANINNATVLSATSVARASTATTASYISIEAVQGQGEQLAALLAAAGPIVAETEPETLFWAAVRIDEKNFAIFDVFADNHGREKHFSGQVANLLNEKSSQLVAGGWNDGVVAKVKNFDVLAVMNH